MSRHPIQPLELDAHQVLRFKQNSMVRYLVDALPGGLNTLGTMEFPQEDWEQLAQLIGYSHSGSADLNYMSDLTWETAEVMYNGGKTEDRARIEVLETTLDNVRDAMKTIIPNLFRLHADDLVT